MEDFQQRVIDEKLALDEKIAKLSSFLKKQHDYSVVAIGELERMGRQLQWMGGYASVLEERIHAFGE